MLSTAEEDLLAGKIPTQQENASRLQEPILPTTSHVISSQENPNPLTRGNGRGSGSGRKRVLLIRLIVSC